MLAGMKITRVAPAARMSCTPFAKRQGVPPKLKRRKSGVLQQTGLGGMLSPLAQGLRELRTYTAKACQKPR
jgi:hypothetical protein